jgi:phage baseplate assembly protein W
MPQQLKAIAVPMRFDATGYPAPAFNDTVLFQSIRTILLTVPGERVMRPTFGCWAKLILFDNLSRASATRAEFEIRRALEQWEPRIEVTGIELSLVRSQILVNISWAASDQRIKESTVTIGTVASGN